MNTGVWTKQLISKIIEEAEEQGKIHVITTLCHGQYNNLEKELLTMEILCMVWIDTFIYYFPERQMPFSD